MTIIGPGREPSTDTPSALDGGALFGWWNWPGGKLVQQAIDYGIDATQRWTLFLDIMRQRGNDHLEQSRKAVPHVLTFKVEPVMSGRELARPANYVLVRIVPPDDMPVNSRSRPFIVFDPRAGHGPGIGGMKHDSEIGAALAAGHPCYFVGFFPEPASGQTIEDVCHAVAAFIAMVAERHPDADGKPCLIGNCQAGWQIMMASAIWRDLPGPIILAGTPLSYWAGIRGKNPLRYLGGVLGGSWLTSLAGDLGYGIFDGANIVSNFEALNPANTYWQKPYNVYAKADTEGPRFIEFERWWGTPTLLTADEMQFIADALFVGNKLTSGDIFTSDGTPVDLRRVTSPILVFCSFGDNITPPPQALDWILDLYEDEHEIARHGQTIIYALHETVGHLGLFVSTKIAKKEHEEFTNAMDLIDVLPPGLYEAVISARTPDMARPELVDGDYLIRFEARSLDDIRALGENTEAENRRFATVARVSEINQGLYRAFLSPFVQTFANQGSADLMRRLHPLRRRFEALSDENPLMRPIEALAETVRSNRRPVAQDNPFLAMERETSRQIAAAWDCYQVMRDAFIENLFTTTYGSPLLQAMTGFRADSSQARRRVGREVPREDANGARLGDSGEDFERGGLYEASIRALVYVSLGREIPAADERSFSVLRDIRERSAGIRRATLAHFKSTVRQQYLLLQADETRALDTLPSLLPDDEDERAVAFDAVRSVVAAQGTPPQEVEMRLARIEKAFSTAPRKTGRDAVEPGWAVAAVEQRERAQRESSDESAAAKTEAAPPHDARG